MPLVTPIPTPDQQVDKDTLKQFKRFFPRVGKLDKIKEGDECTYREIGVHIQHALDKGIKPYLDWSKGSDPAEGKDPYCPTTGEWVKDIRDCPDMLNDG